MKQIALILALALPLAVNAQSSYKDSVAKYWQQYKKEFNTGDTSYLRFYDTDPKFRVTADFTATPDSKPFEITTHSGATKTCKEYGVLSFKLMGAAYKLHIYQLPDMVKKNPKFKNELFLPFTDETNYKETFGGGRYLDLQIPDIKNNKISLDFNYCYNPSCAYASGYSCPIPPHENDLKVAIKAGEKLYGKPVKE